MTCIIGLVQNTDVKSEWWGGSVRVGGGGGGGGGGVEKG